MSYTTSKSATWPWQATPPPAKPHCSKPCCMPAAQYHTAGSVERGTTVSDFDPMEKARGHSLNTAIASTDHGGIHVNLIDTPGYRRFPRPGPVGILRGRDRLHRGQRRRRHRVRHAPDDGSRQGAQTVPGAGREQDRRGAGQAGRIARALRDAFGHECLPMNLPANGGKAVVDCFFNPTGESDFGPFRSAHQRIIDQVVEINEQVMGRYLEEGEAGLVRPGTARRLRAMPARRPPGAGLLRVGAHRRRREGTARPGREPVPESAGRQPAAVREGQRNGQPMARQPDPKAHVIADVFKIVNDPFVGKLGVFRVFQGTVQTRHPACSRRRQEAVQGRPPVQAQGQGPRRDRPGRSRRHRRRGQGRGNPFRRRAARLATTRTTSTCSRSISQADVRPGDRAGHPRPGAEARHRPAQAGRGRPGLPYRAQPGTQRDRDPRPGRAAPAGDARAHEGALRAWK